MFRRFQTVSMMLLLLGTSAGAAHANLVSGTSEVKITQQASTCTGIVKDAFGEVIGASVVVKGTTNGTITGVDGTFSIPNVNVGDVIQISFVGYQTVEVTWGGKPLTVTLKEDSELLQEVVVTAYGGKQLRTKVTNSISKVKEDVLNKGAFTNPAQALSGAVSGLRVQQTSGNPGSAPTIVLRGGTNLDGTGSPLVVVDGQVRESMSDINPDDIESMEVMKDAGATAIYGARANNGVILITTKRGKEGVSEIRFKAKWGINQYTDQYNYLNAGDYLYYIRQAVKRSAELGFGDINSLKGAQPYGTGNIYFNTDGSVADGNKNANAVWSPMIYEDRYAFLLDKGWNTMIDPVYGDKIIYKDFSLEDTNIDKTALSQDYNLSLTGGNDKGNYFLNLGYNNSKGNAIGNEYKRLNATLNADYKIRTWLTSNSSVQVTRADWYDVYDGTKKITDWNATMGMDYFFSRAFSLPPTFRGTNENGEYLHGVRWDLSDTVYPQHLDAMQRDNTNTKINLNQSFTFDIYDGLSLKLGASVYMVNTDYEWFNKDIYSRINTVNTKHESYAYAQRRVDQTYNAVLNYNKQITDDHYVSAMLGTEYYDTYKKGFDAYGYGSALEDFSDLGLTQKDGREIDSWHERQRILSFFGRLNYDYQSKYLISFVARRDGYSKLIGDNRWGFFPGVSAGWVFGKEAFMEPLQNILSFAKLRASYGLNGNVSGVEAYELQGLYGTTQYGGKVGTSLSKLPNPGLRWEKSHTLEVGFDFGFLANRYMANITYYNRRTKDKFANIKLPSHAGLTDWRTNNGELQNQGIELDLNGKIIDTKDWKFSVNANLAWNKNKIISLPHNGLENNRQGAFQVYNQNGDLMWVGGTQEDQSWGDIYGFKADGIYRTYEEITIKRDESTPNNGGGKKILLGPAEWKNLSEQDRKSGKYLPIQPGDVKWRDVNGDGVIDDYDKVKLGNRLPKVTGGITFNLGWKSLTLNARMDYALGHTVVDNKTPWIMGAMQGSYNTIDLTKDSWSPENPNGKYPIYLVADQNLKRNYARDNNSLFVYKGDYLAFREISLSYDMPKAWVSKVGLQSLQLSFTAQNLGYLTAADTMYSPEYGADSNGGYALPRSYVFGINLSF